MNYEISTNLQLATIVVCNSRYINDSPFPLSGLSLKGKEAVNKLFQIKESLMRSPLIRGDVYRQRGEIIITVTLNQI